MGIVVKPLSGAASRLKREAYNLARRVVGGGVIHRIREIFIIRAVGGSEGNATATILEAPTHVIGGYGGQDGPTDYYTHAVVVDAGALMDAISRDTVKTDDGTPVPNIPIDKFKIRLPMGEGRVAIGDLPAWEATREGLNGSTGVVSNVPSALLVSVCPALTTETPENHPWLRSVVICRANGYMTGGPILAGYDGIRIDGLVQKGHPAITGTVHTKRPETLSGVEIAQSLLDLGPDDELQYAGSSVEWGPLQGVGSAMVRTLSPSRLSTIDTSLRFFGYSITDSGTENEGRYAGVVSWVSKVDKDTVPDGPEELSAVTGADPEFTYPMWATAGTAIGGRDAIDPRMTIRDINTFCRVWGNGLGYSDPVDTPTIALVEVKSLVNAADVSVRGYKSDDEGGATFNTVSAPESYQTNYTTYVLSIGSTGVVTYAKLSEFSYTRYDSSQFADLERPQYQAFGGFNTAATPETPEQARLFCSIWSEKYEVKPADPDGDAPNNVQGEPERRVLVDFSQYVALDDLQFVLISGSGAQTPLQFGAYYPMLYVNRETLGSAVGAPANTRYQFAATAFFDAAQRLGQSYPQAFCQFAPGYAAFLVANKSAYTDRVQDIRVAVMHVESGAMSVLSPVLLAGDVTSRLTLSCIERGLLDDKGAFTSYGRLLLSASTFDNTPTRTDGLFVITGLNSITWLAREPSNVSGHYVGNPLVPAEVGVTSKLSVLIPPAIPET